MSYHLRVPSPMPTKMLSSSFQLCNELSISVQKYFPYPTKNDHVRRIDRYLGRLTSICLGIMLEFLLVIWRGKGKLAAKWAVG